MVPVPEQAVHEHEPVFEPPAISTLVSTTSEVGKRRAGVGTVRLVSPAPALKIRCKFGSTQSDLTIDTGAPSSCLSLNLFNELAAKPSLDPCSITLSTASGSNLEVYGEVLLTFSIPKLRRTFSCQFIVCDVSTSILGLDFLTEYKMIVDCQKSNLRDAMTN